MYARDNYINVKRFFLSSPPKFLVVSLCVRVSVFWLQFDFQLLISFRFVFIDFLIFKMRC